VKTGVQGIYEGLKILDSGFHRNDAIGHFPTFYKIINTGELLAKVTYSVIPAKAGIQKCSKILDSGSRFACPE
jgi:hypothetical protein